MIVFQFYQEAREAYATPKWATLLEDRDRKVKKLSFLLLLKISMHRSEVFVCVGGGSGLHTAMFQGMGFEMIKFC